MALVLPEPRMPILRPARNTERPRVTEPHPWPIGPLCQRPICGHDSCWQIRTTPAGPPRFPIERVDAAMVAWLQQHAADIRRHPEAPTIAKKLHQLANRTERVIDNRDPGVFFGRCEAEAVTTTEVDGRVTVTVHPGQQCGADLIGRDGDEWVTCPACGTQWPTAEVEEWLRAAAREVWLRPRDIVDALRARGEKITLEKLRNWIARDKAEHDAGRVRRVPYPPILQVGSDPAVDAAGRPIMQPLLDEHGDPVVDEDGRPVEVQATKPLYRVGDVLGRLEALAELDDQRRRKDTA